MSTFSRYITRNFIPLQSCTCTCKRITIPFASMRSYLFEGAEMTTSSYSGTCITIPVTIICTLPVKGEDMPTKSSSRTCITTPSTTTCSRPLKYGEMPTKRCSEYVHLSHLHPLCCNHRKAPSCCPYSAAHTHANSPRLLPLASTSDMVIPKA